MLLSLKVVGAIQTQANEFHSVEPRLYDYFSFDSIYLGRTGTFWVLKSSKARS